MISSKWVMYIFHRKESDRQHMLFALFSHKWLDLFVKCVFNAARLNIPNILKRFWCYHSRYWWSGWYSRLEVNTDLSNSVNHLFPRSHHTWGKHILLKKTTEIKICIVYIHLRQFCVRVGHFHMILHYIHQSLLGFNVIKLQSSLKEF